MNKARLLFGSVVLALGSLLLLEYTNVLDAAAVIEMWWPVVLIAAGLLGFFSDRRHWLVPLAIVGLGTMALLRTTEVVDDLELAGPLFLVLTGLLVIFGRSVTRQIPGSQDRLSNFNVFSGSEIASKSEHFEGGSIGALFGGTELDLRHAKPAPGAELDVFVAFGGAEIRVPEGWQVVTHGMPIFGGFENVTTTEPLQDGAPTLDVNATVIFGGLEVKH